MQYRRAKTPGGTYFFTIVTYQRQKLFSTPQNVDLLRQAFRSVKQRHPFTIDAIEEWFISGLVVLLSRIGINLQFLIPTRKGWQQPTL